MISRDRLLDEILLQARRRLPAAGHVVARVDGDPVEPRREGGIPSERRQMPEAGEEYVLCGVASILRPSQHAVRQVVYTTLVPLHEHDEGVLVAGLEAGDQRLIRGFRGPGARTHPRLPPGAALHGLWPIHRGPSTVTWAIDAAKRPSSEASRVIQIRRPAGRPGFSSTVTVRFEFIVNSVAPSVDESESAVSCGTEPALT